MPEHFDVLIAGAGISGVGSACHLKQQCPEKTFVVLEGLDKQEMQYAQEYWREKYDIPAIDLNGAELNYGVRKGN